MKHPIYLLIGVPGSGKTWCTDRVAHRFHFLHHDGFFYLKHPGAYLKDILEQAPTIEKPMLIEAPFSISETLNPLLAAGYDVKQVYILEPREVVAMRYLRREGKHCPPGHLTRLDTYRKRAEAGATFSGTTEEVVKFLSEVPV